VVHRKPARRLQIGNDVEDIHKKYWKSEYKAISGYSASIKIAQEVGNSGTRELLESIFEDEETHIQAVDLTGRDFGVPSKNLRLRAQVISPAGQTAFIAVLVPLESDLSASLVLLIRLSEQTSSSYYAA
jgi:rubrerythrin